MKKIIPLVCILICLSTRGLCEEFHANDAVALAGDFMSQLEKDLPITFADEEKYFGTLTLYSVAILMDLGFVDEKGAWIKSKPHYSYLGELIRMNSSLLLLENPEQKYIFSGIPQKILPNGSMREQLFYAEIAIVQHQKTTPAGYGGESRIIDLRYAIPRKKLDFPIYVNGESFAELIGFEFSQPKGIPSLKKEIKEKLLEHIKYLEQNQQ